MSNIIHGGNYLKTIKEVILNKYWWKMQQAFQSSLSWHFSFSEASLFRVSWEFPWNQAWSIMEPRSKTEGVIRLDYSTGMEMGICREADLIIINHPIDESAGWAVVSVTEYIGVPRRHLRCIQLHVTLQWLCNKADSGLWPLLWWPSGLVIHFVLRIQAFNYISCQLKRPS